MLYGNREKSNDQTVYRNIVAYFTLNVRKHVDFILKNNGKGNIPIAILGNKTNLRNNSNSEPVKMDEIQLLLRKLNEIYQSTTYRVYYHDVDFSIDSGFNSRKFFNFFGKQYLQMLNNKKSDD